MLFVYGGVGHDDGHIDGQDTQVDLKLDDSYDDDRKYDDDFQVDLCKKRKFHEKFGGHHYFLR